MVLLSIPLNKLSSSTLKKFHGGFPPGYESVKKVMCEKCSEEFLTSGGLKMHRKKQFCNPSQGEKIICCDQCGPEESFKHSSRGPFIYYILALVIYRASYIEMKESKWL